MADEEYDESLEDFIDDMADEKEYALKEREIEELRKKDGELKEEKPKEEKKRRRGKVEADALVLEKIGEFEISEEEKVLATEAAYEAVFKKRISLMAKSIGEELNQKIKKRKSDEVITALEFKNILDVKKSGKLFNAYEGEFNIVYRDIAIEDLIKCALEGDGFIDLCLQVVNDSLFSKEVEAKSRDLNIYAEDLAFI